ncbi:superoxide dismutase [Desulfoscipio sp. XC116]|uniref:superoxide dismutase n=1 Tax=Desulfoscipio sp. XC116 TaxID=3144975 RepID=UPI00325BFEF3
MINDKRVGPESSTLSAEQLEHHYNAYFNVHRFRLREIRARLLKADTSYTDLTFSLLRALKKEEAWAMNSVVLHNNYFESLGLGQNKPSSGLINMLIRDFGSVEEWLEQFMALGLGSRGWVVLGLDLCEGKLANYIADDHSEGIWLVFPLLVLDVFEHAYQMDYKSAKNKYIKRFIDNVDWRSVNFNLETAGEIYKIITARKGIMVSE